MSSLFSDPFQIQMHKRMDTFGQAGHLMNCRFDRDNGKVPQLRLAEKYVSHWEEMHRKGLGLLLWGPPGSGKTFAAACIANAFLDSKDPFPPKVIMTDFGTVLRQSLAATPQQRQEELSRLLETGLLILDDFGAERQTDYTQEQIYHIINGRYIRQAPLIVTTNLTLQQLKNGETLQQQRICDRLLEMCVPVCFDADSLRKDKAAANLRFFRDLCRAETVAESPDSCYDTENQRNEEIL